MIVHTKVPCDNTQLYAYFLQMQKKYPFFHFQSIGKSVLQQDIYCARLGFGEKNIFICGAHHALEWITTLLLVKFIEEYCNAKSKNKTIFDHDIAKLFENTSIFIVPLVNPDGVDLVLKPFHEKHPRYEALCKMIDKKEIHTKWQANINGVDLNHNYNAHFEKGKELERTYGIYSPGPTRFGGIYPESEPETKALCDFVRKRKFDLALSYHAQGSVIYWHYGDKTPPQSESMAKAFSAVSGYLPDFTQGIASYRGFKDWFIDTFEMPAFTIEVGMGKNPLPISHFDNIFFNNIELLLLSALL